MQWIISEALYYENELQHIEKRERTLCLDVVEGNLRKVQSRQHVHAIRLV